MTSLAVPPIVLALLIAQAAASASFVLIKWLALQLSVLSSGKIYQVSTRRGRYRSYGLS
jgi:hypothetical protein